MQTKKFNLNIKLFLSATIISGIINNTWQLFFNFFILARGFDVKFLGLVNSMPSISGLILGIPLGMLSDRIGRKKAMFIGVAISATAMGMQVLVKSGWLLLVMAFLGGVGNSLYFISQAPFMMKSSDKENRSLIFSLNFGLNTLAGSVGNLFAGQLPGWFGNLLNVSPESATAYQFVLLTAVFFGIFALIPLFFIKEEKKIPQTGSPTEINQITILKSVVTKSLTWKLVLPEMLLGFGAAITIPYMNLYFSKTFAASSQSLGVLFSISSLVVGVGSIIGPKLVSVFRSKIKVVVLTQSSSLVFLLILAFTPLYWIASVAFLLRGMLMNMAVPLYNAFCMENVNEQEQGVVNSLISNSWTMGWAIGPVISGFIQARFGFSPLFIVTAVIYLFSISFTWIFFRNYETTLQ